MTLDKSLLNGSDSSAGSNSGESDDESNCSQGNADPYATHAFPFLLMSQVTRNVPKQLTRRRHLFVSERVDSGGLDFNGSMFRHGTEIMSPNMIVKVKLPELWPTHCRMPNMK